MPGQEISGPVYRESLVDVLIGVSKTQVQCVKEDHGRTVATKSSYRLRAPGARLPLIDGSD